MSIYQVRLGRGEPQVEVGVHVQGTSRSGWPQVKFSCPRPGTGTPEVKFSCARPGTFGWASRCLRFGSRPWVEVRKRLVVHGQVRVGLNLKLSLMYTAKVPLGNGGPPLAFPVHVQLPDLKLSLMSMYKVPLGRGRLEVEFDVHGHMGTAHVMLGMAHSMAHLALCPFHSYCGWSTLYLSGPTLPPHTAHLIL